MSHPAYVRECYPVECSNCGKNWNCQLDFDMVCSPDCEFINPETGKPDSENCEGCDALEARREKQHLIDKGFSDSWEGRQGWNDS